MLNSEQLQVVHSPAEFLIIDGDYGTGKTYILKERAKKCATNNHENQIFLLVYFLDNAYKVLLHIEVDCKRMQTVVVVLVTA